jgi:site-specific DNA recombinase
LIRAAIYARYSSALHTDHAISGSIRLRPGYQKLLEGARSGEFDVVVSEALDRLSRDQEDVAALYKHLSFSGVKLITIGEGEISELHVGLKGTMNALFLKDLRVKVKCGLEGRVRQGRSGGGLSYDYDVGMFLQIPRLRAFEQP